jgi:hypothetical protein
VLEFRYRVAIKKHIKAKCGRHPRYSPERDGRGGVVGGCKVCGDICDLWEARVRLDADVARFERLVAPWTVGKPAHE